MSRPEAPATSSTVRPMSTVERAMCNGSVWPAECSVPQYGSVVNGALGFRRLPSREAVVEEFSRVLLAHVRFHSLARSDGTWEPTDVDMAHHIAMEHPVADTESAREVRLLLVASALHHLLASLLCEAIEVLIAQDLEVSRPLWRVHLIPVQAEGELSVLLLRVHHCIGDGSAIASLFQSLARREDGQPVDETALMRRLAQERSRRQQACSMAKVCNTVAMGADAVKSFFANASVPYRRLETDTKVTKPRSERKGACRFGSRRHVVYVPPHSLDYVKACKTAAQRTLNDVVLSATSGALRRYCELRGDPAFASGQRVRARALLPVANPDAVASAEDCIANNFAFVSCRLALSAADPLERLRQTGTAMTRIKRSTKAMVSLWQTNHFAKCLPERQQQKLAKDLFANHSLIFSNLPGPDAPIYIAGEPLEEVQAIFPNFLSQVILLSYNGRIHMNFTVDPDLIEESDSLAECYLAELRSIGAALGVAGDPLAFHPVNTTAVSPVVGAAAGAAETSDPLATLCAESAEASDLAAHAADAGAGSPSDAEARK